MNRRYGVPTPKKHDHVGHMTFTTSKASCDSCGQTWILQMGTDREGNPVPLRWTPVMS